MKIGAGIAGILLGLVSLLYVGLFGGMIGAVVGSTNPLHDSTVTAWASMVSLLSWLAPLLAIIGGIVTFSKPRAGSIVLAASACLLLYLLGFGFVGKVFGLPIGAAAILAFFAAPKPLVFESQDETPVSPRSTEPIPSAAKASFDRNKWNALVQYDKEIAVVAERLQPLGQRWMDEFASSYLALNDKQYLQSIEEKIVAAAKADVEENERRNVAERAEHERQRIIAEERRKKDHELWQARARASGERIALWRERLWGTRQRKIWVSTCSVLLVAIAAGGFFARKQYEDSQALQRYTLNFLSSSPRGTTLGEVVVVSGYALLPWADRVSSGSALLRYDADRRRWLGVQLGNWIGGGQTAPWDVTTLLALHVPQPIAQELSLRDAARANSGVVKDQAPAISSASPTPAEDVVQKTPAGTAAAPGEYSDAFEFCRAVQNRDDVDAAGDSGSKYVGADPPAAVGTAMMRANSNLLGPYMWRCMESKVYGCYVGASGRACRIVDSSEKQVSAINQFCAANPNSSSVPNSVNNSPWQWRCEGSTAVVNRSYPVEDLDKRGFVKSSWLLVEQGKP